MSKKMRWGAALAAVLAGSGVLGMYLWKRAEGHRIAREGYTAIEAIRKVARLSTVEMNVSTFQLKKDTRNLLGFIPIKCEKTVAVFYRGSVAAGYDLQEGSGLTATVAAGGDKRLVVELPEPKILYTDAPPPEVVVADGSICNRLGPDDYKVLGGEARAALQRQALEGGILKKADEHARELITTLAGSLGFRAEVRTRVSAVSIR